MEPYNYAAQLQAPSFVDSLTRGFAAGSAIQDQQLQQQAAQQKLLQQQQAAAQQAAQQAQLQAFADNPNPTAEDYAKITRAMPQLADHFKKSWDILQPAQQDSKWNRIVSTYAALQNEKPGVASKILNDHADALEASGDQQEAKVNRDLAQVAENDPVYAKKLAYLNLYSIDPKKATDLSASLDSQAKNAADLPGQVADSETKKLSVVGSTLGALEGKNTKPAQVQLAIKTLAKRGVIDQSEAQDYLASIPTDQNQIDSFLKTHRLAGVSAKEQTQLVTPDANTVANNATSRANNAANNANSIAVQKMIGDRQDVDASLDQDSLQTMAAQYLAGDKSVMQNLGRGNQGAANIVALRKEITSQAKASGMTGPQIAAQMADYSGLAAGIRTSANISARVENAIAEAKELAPLAIAAGKDVARSGFLPFGKAQVMFDTQTNNPALKRFATANNGLITAYGGAMARGQKPTVSDYEHARSILTAAQSQEAYEATVNQMFSEMAAASRAPQNVREHLRGEISGNKGASTVPNPVAPAAGLPAGWSVEKH